MCDRDGVSGRVLCACVGGARVLWLRVHLHDTMASLIRLVMPPGGSGVSFIAFVAASPEVGLAILSRSHTSHASRRAAVGDPRESVARTTTSESDERGTGAGREGGWDGIVSFHHTFSRATKQK